MHIIKVTTRFGYEATDDYPKWRAEAILVLRDAAHITSEDLSNINSATDAELLIMLKRLASLAGTYISDSNKMLMEYDLNFKNQTTCTNTEVND